MNTKKIVYMVTYQDDRHRTHMTFVNGISAVRLLMDRFSDVYFQEANTYPQYEEDDEEIETLIRFFF